MIALFIILGLLLLIFLVLLIRVRVFFSYDDSVTLKIKILFYELVILSPYKEKKPKKKKEKKPEKKKEKKETEEKEKKEEKPKKKSLIGSLKDKHGLPGLLSLFTDILKIATGALSGIITHMFFSRFDLDLIICSQDSAQTALTYGKACSAIYPAVSALSKLTEFKDYNIFICPKFDGEKNEIYFVTELYLRPIFAVHYALVAGIKLLGMYIKEKFSKE